MIYANVTFAHTDDPYMKGVAFAVLPRAGEDVAIIRTPTPDSPHQRIDYVARVRHFVGGDEPTIELILDDKPTR